MFTIIHQLLCVIIETIKIIIVVEVVIAEQLIVVRQIGGISIIIIVAILFKILRSVFWIDTIVIIIRIIVPLVIGAIEILLLQLAFFNIRVLYIKIRIRMNIISNIAQQTAKKTTRIIHLHKRIHNLLGIKVVDSSASLSQPFWKSCLAGDAPAGADFC